MRCRPWRTVPPPRCKLTEKNFSIASRPKGLGRESQWALPLSLLIEACPPYVDEIGALSYSTSTPLSSLSYSSTARTSGSRHAPHALAIVVTSRLAGNTQEPSVDHQLVSPVLSCPLHALHGIAWRGSYNLNPGPRLPPDRHAHPPDLQYPVRARLGIVHPANQLDVTPGGPPPVLVPTPDCKQGPGPPPSPPFPSMQLPHHSTGTPRCR